MNYETVICLIIVFVACVAFNVYFGVKGIKKPYTAEELAKFLERLARMAVEATEQITANSNEHGGDKYDIAFGFLENLLSDTGLADTFDTRSITAAIEQAVRQMNTADTFFTNQIVCDPETARELLADIDTSEGEPDEIEEVGEEQCVYVNTL